METILKIYPIEMLKSSFLEAICDCIGIIPLLFVIFFIIEIIEHFYTDKILSFSKFSKKAGPFVGALLAAIPQCGLSIIASTMYCKHFITKGTLLAVYLATSDEAIPVLLASSERFKIIFPLIGIKLIVALFAGYLTDLILPSKLDLAKMPENIEIEKGCHSHNIIKESKKARFNELFIHPLIHTLSIAFFIFAITFIINLSVNTVSHGAFSAFDITILKNNFLQPAIAAIFGIIPNCAISVGITVLYLKGAITFASCISGLCTGAGLGILVLIKNNESKKDTGLILALLLIISIFAGYLTEIFSNIF